MAEADVESRRNIYRFYCHRCNVEFEDVLQNNACPYCASGFIEQMDHERDGDSFVSSAMDGEVYSDTDMSHLDEIQQPMYTDLAFLMSGGRLRPASGSGSSDSGTGGSGTGTGTGSATGAGSGTGTGTGASQRSDGRSLVEQLVVMIGGSRAGATTAGAPFVLVGAPGDYVFGGEGLDAVVTQLLGQLENTGPPPLTTEQIDAIASEKITAAQVESNMSCSVCWDNFVVDESVSRLVCEHIFHPACIKQWVQLHATCPICRRSLLTPEQLAEAQRAPPQAEVIIGPAGSSSSTTTTQPDAARLPTAYSRVVVRRLGGRRRRAGSAGGGSPPRGIPRALWSQLTSHFTGAGSAPASASATDSVSTSTISSADRDSLYMDIDYD